MTRIRSSERLNGKPSILNKVPIAVSQKTAPSLILGLDIATPTWTDRAGETKDLCVSVFPSIFANVRTGKIISPVCLACLFVWDGVADAVEDYPDYDEGTVMQVFNHVCSQQLEVFNEGVSVLICFVCVLSNVAITNS